MEKILTLGFIFFADILKGNLFAQNGYKCFEATVDASTGYSKYISVLFKNIIRWLSYFRFEFIWNRLLPKS